MKVLLKIFFTLCLVLGLALYSLPYVARDQVVIWLTKNGAQHATFKDVSVRWLSGKVELHNLKASSPGKPDLDLERLVIGLDYSSLFKKQILINQLDLKGLHSGLVQQGKDIWLGPINLNQFKSDSVKEDQSEDADNSGILAGWSFGLSNLAIRDIRWSLKTPEQNQAIVIENADMSSLMEWDSGQSTQLSLKGLLNGAGFNISTQATPLLADKKTQLQLKLTSFPIESVLKPWLPELKGKLTTDLVINLRLNGGSIDINHQGLIKLDGLDFAQDKLTVKNPHLVWQGKGSVTLRQQRLTATKFSGKLALTDPVFSESKQSLVVSAGAINWQGSVDLTLNADQLKKLSSDNQLTLSAVKVKASEHLVQAKTLALNSPLVMQPVTAGSKNPSNKMSVSPQIKLEQLSYQQGEQLSVSFDRLTGKLGVKDMPLDNIQLQGLQAELLGLNVELPKAKYELAQIESMVLNNGHYSDKLFGLDRLILSGIKLSRPQSNTAAYLTKAEKLNISKLNFVDQSKLSIKKVELSNSQTRLSRNKNEQIVELKQLMAALATLENQTSSKDKSAQSDKAPIQLKIKTLTTTGHQYLKFKDASVNPAFNSKLDISKLSIKNLDTAKDNLAPFSVAAKVNDYAVISAQGALNLLGNVQNGHWTLDMNNVGLPVLSPYAGKYIGYYLKRGQMNLKSEGTLKQGKLLGKNHIVLNRLDVQSAKVKATQDFNKKLTMPLGTAIAILQDSDDNIVLDVPVDGSLADPNFGYQSVINILASKGLKQAAFGFLTQALQPYGALITLASTAISANESGAFIKLEPVTFATGEAALSADMQKYLAKIAEMLASREGLRLNLCANATYLDKVALLPKWIEENQAQSEPLDEAAFAEAVDDHLQTLAVSRNEAVINKLLQQKIDKGRLFACFPVPDLEDKKLKGAVSLGL